MESNWKSWFILVFMIKFKLFQSLLIIFDLFLNFSLKIRYDIINFVLAIDLDFKNFDQNSDSNMMWKQSSGSIQSPKLTINAWYRFFDDISVSMPTMNNKATSSLSKRDMCPEQIWSNDINETNVGGHWCNILYYATLQQH